MTHYVLLLLFSFKHLLFLLVFFSHLFHHEEVTDRSFEDDTFRLTYTHIHRQVQFYFPFLQNIHSSDCVNWTHTPRREGHGQEDSKNCHIFVVHILLYLLNHGIDIICIYMFDYSIMYLHGKVYKGSKVCLIFYYTVAEKNKKKNIEHKKLGSPSSVGLLVWFWALFCTLWYFPYLFHLCCYLFFSLLFIQPWVRREEELLKHSGTFSSPRNPSNNMKRQPIEKRAGILVNPG